MVKLYAIRRRGGWDPPEMLQVRIERVEVARPVALVARRELAWSDQP